MIFAVIVLILLIFGLGCLLMAAFYKPEPQRINFLALGLVFWILSVIAINARAFGH